MNCWLGAYSRGGLFQCLTFSSKVDIKYQHNFLNQLNKALKKRLFHKQNSLVINDFFIVIAKATLFCFFVSSQRKLYRIVIVMCGLLEKILFCNYASIEKGHMGGLFEGAAYLQKLIF